MSGGSGKSLFILVMFLLFLTGPGATNGAALDFPGVEKQTLRLYNEQKWDSVIIIGKQALKDDIDYYYLRLRIGISYFRLEKYFPAAEHLEKAIAFNSMDPFPYQYLYTSFIRTNRTDEAGRLVNKMRINNIKQEEALKPPLFTYLYAEGGYSFSSDNDRAPTGDLFGTDSIYGEEDLYGNSTYLHLGTKLHLTPSISLTAAYSFFDFKKIKNVQYGTVTDRLDSTRYFTWGWERYYTFPRKTSEKTFHYDVYQHELYLGFDMLIQGGFHLKPAFHMIYNTYSVPDVSIRREQKTDTLTFVYYNSNARTFRFDDYNYGFSSNDTSYFNYVAALDVSATVDFFRIGFGGSFSNLNDEYQYQAAIALTYYPFGNLSFYGKTTATGFAQGNDSRLIIQQLLGGKVMKMLWLEGNFIYGDLTNANLENGSLVYNNTGKTKYLAGLSVIAALTEHLDVLLNGQYTSRESEQLTYTMQPSPNGPETSTITKYNPYSTFITIGGIKWKF